MLGRRFLRLSTITVVVHLLVCQAGFFRLPLALLLLALASLSCGNAVRTRGEARMQGDCANKWLLKVQKPLC